MTTRKLLIIGGGQSGLAAARAASRAGWRPVILEAGERAVGSWPGYYDSLTLFSPAEYSGFPGYAFPGDPGCYPVRDEVVSFLAGYADWLGVELHTGTRVSSVAADAGHYLVRADSGAEYEADAVIAATGSFGHPYRPSFAGSESFGGRQLHVADYRAPEHFAGQRVVVVGAGNSAIQIGYELAAVARVSLAVRSPLNLVPQLRAGRDTHYWLKTLRLDLLPPSVLSRLVKGTLVFDPGNYQAALDSGRLDQRPVFEAFVEGGVRWADGATEAIDTVIFATGYRPSLPYLDELRAVDDSGRPLHRRGLSLTHSGLGYLGLEFQRSFSSNTLRGVHRDADFVLAALTGRTRASATLAHSKGKRS